MTDREKLIEILRKPIFPHELADPTEALADYLLDNGVKVVGAQTDLTGKCGSCAFAKPTRFGSSNCYVECTNEDHLSRRTKRYAEAKRQRTSKACKSYVPLPEPPKED